MAGNAALVAQVGHCHAGRVDDGEGAAAWEHQILEQLGAEGAGVDEANFGPLQGFLPVVAPQPGQSGSWSSRTWVKTGRAVGLVVPELSVVFLSLFDGHGHGGRQLLAARVL
jgi:hypothetical protein